MDDLRKVLASVPDKYTDFVNGICSLLSDDEEYQKKVVTYIEENPEAKTDDVLDFLREYLDSIELDEDEELDEDDEYDNY